MEFRQIIYPSPLSSYNILDPDLIWIPKPLSNPNPSLYKSLQQLFIKPLSLSPTPEDNLIPAFYMPYIDNQLKQGAQDLLIYYHANGEDIGTCYELMIQLLQELKVNILSIEYPSYGVYNGQPTEKRILEDSEDIIKYCINGMGFSITNIILMGRSLGTGPITHIASLYQNFKMVVLVSPFMSLKHVARKMFGD